MRGIDTEVRKARRRVFKEVADLAYHSENLIDDMEALPYKINWIYIKDIKAVLRVCVVQLFKFKVYYLRSVCYIYFSHIIEK